MSASNRITKVAIIGAGGNSGKGMAEQLLATGQHTVTSLTRADSVASLPAGIKSVVVDYDKPETITEALRGQDAFIITIPFSAPAATHSKLVQAAAQAGVPWVLPNHWSHDTTDYETLTDIPLLAAKRTQLKEIQDLGVSSFVAVATGSWYEWSLAMPEGFGFDLKERRVTFFDDGNAKLTVSTWSQVGRGVAALLSLPIKPEENDDRRSLDAHCNQEVYIGSFTVTQQEIFQSVLRVTGTTADQWSVSYEPSHERVAKAIEADKNGDRTAFIKVMYTRMFYPGNEIGNYEKNRGLLNDVLHLNKEDLDEATRAAIRRSKELHGW